MDIAVVDDEKAIREHICGLVEERQPESRIEAYATGEELLASGKRFDIVFLDIQMEGMNGIEAARGLREKNANLGVGDTVLVFVTGIKDYVFDAFDLYAFQYLLKPMLLRIIMITLEDGMPKMLYDRYPILVIVIPAILLLSLLSILYGVKLFQDMIYWNREKSGRIVLENQISSLQEHMEEMERIYSGIRGMKHDMKNTIAVIQRLSAGEGSGELQEYLSELNSGLEKLEVRFRTGNTVVDTLLNMKYHEAVRDMPDLRMEADKLLLPQGIQIHSYDIGVILGNAVDNAIEACRKLKAKESGVDAFIRISSLQKGKLLILKVENSFDGRLVLKAKEEFPVTDKADRKSHGIGLANIKSTAEKYQGAVGFKVNGRVFILSVMMKNERREEDGFRSDR